MARSNVATPSAVAGKRGTPRAAGLRGRKAPPPPPPKKSPLRLWKWWLAGLVVVVVALAARLFVHPAHDEVTAANAVVVVGGGEGGRLEAALELMNRGAAPVLVLPGGTDPAWPAANRLCAGGTPFEVVCPARETATVRGDARVVGALAQQRQWQTVAVVAAEAQLSRTAMLTKRCTEASVLRVGVAGGGTAVVGELFRYAGALIADREC